jgi:class 3 adenylate cyclase/tetratricopeptide (TPR) repeat protein
MGSPTCPACGTDNPQGARFCMACGTALERRCPNCGAVAPAGARFCVECGTALTASARPPARPEERRQVAVLFADLSGYTAVAETLDPEALHQLVDRCLRRLGEEVERYGGTVDKYIGDNVMATFGAPVAHEDDPERAVRAALGMQDAMTEINADVSRRHGVSFALRVGVNSGEVVAGAIGGGYTVIGDAVNVAARLQAAARPGSVTVGERTYRATTGAIEYVRLDPLVLKGKAEPVPAWEAVALIAMQPSRRTVPLRPPAPLIGRDFELELLGSLFDRVCHEERPHLVTVVGQAGVGKSRLLAEFDWQLAERDPPPAVRSGRCLPYGSGVVYWALGEVLRSELDIVDSDTSDVAWRKLETGIAELLAGERADTDGLEREAALIGRVLGIEPPPGMGPAIADDPQRLRESFFGATRAVIEAMAQRRSLVLAFEDVHWADEGMLDLIEHLAQWVRGRLLILCLAREELLERRAPWGSGRRNATALGLEPLSIDQTRLLVDALLPDADGDARALVTARADGNPLFVEEMARLLTEEGESAELPETVQALLAARLDSLAPLERSIVQYAAVSGRTFWAGSLAGLAQEERGDLREALQSLQEKDLIERVPGSELAGEHEFAFKHVLVRDVAYSMLPKAVRARRHYEVGRYVEEHAGDRAEEFVTLLAEHFGRAATLAEQSGLDPDTLDPMHARAVRYLEAAGDAAARLYSNGEAFDHYAAACRLRLEIDPAVRARIREKQGDVALALGRVDAAIEAWEECSGYHRGQEDLRRLADLQRKVGSALWHKGETRGAIERYQKGISLLKDGPPAMELVRLYEEEASLYMHTGDNMLAVYASERALRLAERLGEVSAASRAHGIFGTVFGRIGDRPKARDSLERSVELARDSGPAETIRALLTLGSHLEITAADYPAARAAYVEALEVAERIGDMPAQVELYSALALLAAYRGEWDEVGELTEASAGLAEREGLVGKMSYPYALRGLLRWRDGDFDAAEALYRRAIDLAEQVGWPEVQFSALLGLALALRDAGDTGGAVTALDQALDVCERAGLVAQSIQAVAARALALQNAGRHEQAEEAADEAGRLAERLGYPVAEASALDARGATAEDPREAAALLERAKWIWLDLGRPLDAARCDLLAGERLAGTDAAGSRDARAEAAKVFEQLGVPHMAERARAAVAADR